MFVLAVKPASPLTALQLRHLEKGLVDGVQSQKAGRGDMFTAVLDKNLSEWHFITKSTLVGDRYGRRGGKIKQE